MLWNPARAQRSSTGERSPASHGVNTTPPLPGADLAAISVTAGKLSSSSGATTLSRSHCRHSPAVSWLSAMRYGSVATPGTDAMPWMASVFLKDTGQLIHDVVLIAI